MLIVEMFNSGPGADPIITNDKVRLLVIQSLLYN